MEAEHLTMVIGGYGYKTNFAYVLPGVIFIDCLVIIIVGNMICKK